MHHFMSRLAILSCYFIVYFHVINKMAKYAMENMNSIQRIEHSLEQINYKDVYYIMIITKTFHLKTQWYAVTLCISAALPFTMHI